MRSTFNLKEPKKNRPTSIKLIAFFSKEDDRFVYYTGEVIHPNDWDFKLRQPKHLTGRNAKANEMRSIKRQIERYADFLDELHHRHQAIKETLTIDITRAEFDREFKRAKARASKFFDIYDQFMTDKINDRSGRGNSESTIKRYQYNKKLLEEFEQHRRKKINFNSISKPFYNELIDFCIKVKRHSVNTLSRNMGLLKTFLNWAYSNNYTYKDEFKEFHNIKKEVTQEIALTFDQVIQAYEFDLNNNKRLERVRDLFVFGCTTGMRYSNYSKVTRSDVYNDHVNIRDKKNSDKLLSIPLNNFSKAILEKYDYKLPVIANQKFNDYIKEVFQALGYDQIIKKTARIGNEIIETETPLYKRISSHTARRSFITIMKNKKIPDKVIMSYTGHKSLETFNKYYKPNDDDKVDFMNSVWSLNYK